MERKLILNDGTELSGYAYAAGDLFFYLSDITMAEAFELLNNPEKTVMITDEMGNEFEMYTDLRCITKEDNGKITGSLRRVID